MQPIKMAACGLLLTFTFARLFWAIVWPLQGVELLAITHNSTWLAFDILVLMTLYREEVKVYWELNSRRPGK